MRKQLIDLSVDLLQALLWQHNNAPRITAILRLKNEWYRTNQEDFWQAWIRDVFDLRTCNELGLKVWSIILGTPLTIIYEPTTKRNFGFGTYNLNFNRGNFGVIGSGGVGLSLENARILLRLRYFQLVTRPTVYQINEFLAYLFGQGNIYCIEQGGMAAAEYVFTQAPGTEFVEMLKYYDVLPRPAAVGTGSGGGVIDVRPAFGFGDFYRNFNRGTFRS